jgi:hypothetical protein
MWRFAAASGDPPRRLLTRLDQRHVAVALDERDGAPSAFGADVSASTEPCLLVKE